MRSPVVWPDEPVLSAEAALEMLCIAGSCKLLFAPRAMSDESPGRQSAPFFVQGSGMEWHCNGARR